MKTRKRKTLAECAAAYCAAKDQEDAIRKSLRMCEGRDAVGYTYPCWQRMEGDECEPCEACDANEPALRDLRAVRNRMGGLIRAMRAAYREAAGRGEVA